MGKKKDDTIVVLKKKKEEDVVKITERERFRMIKYKFEEY
jgi:hypothetical protein